MRFSNSGDMSVSFVKLPFQAALRPSSTDTRLRRRCTPHGRSRLPGFDATAWFALLAPAGTPEPIIAKLHREAVRILALPDVRIRFDELGMVPMGTSPAQFAAAIASEAPLWAKVIKASGAKLVD